jgi:AraC family transcriptional regulator
MQEINIDSGLYATFIYKGIAADYPKVFQYVLQQWIPENNYQIDNRPFFEILSEKYKRDAEDSEEEVWIPIKGSE